MSPASIRGFLDAFLLIYSLLYFCSVLMVMGRNTWKRMAKIEVEFGLFVACFVIVLGVCILMMPQYLLFFIAASFYFLVILFPYFFFLPTFHLSGRFFMVANYVLYVIGAMWGYWFIATIDISLPTRILLFITYPLGLIMIPPTLLQFFENFEVLCHSSWQRPKHVIASTGTYFPMVSIHVPAHAEPPELVIATLNKLAHLRYPNFEVLLIDNNTDDEALWKPVEKYCHELGSQFHFIRLTNWPGAKAGALNHAVTVTDPEAELIAVVDADYHADPEFLQNIVGYFEDPKMGFVQTPHDYRDWGTSHYLRNCYWEYELFFKTAMVSYNERNSGITVGTMCVIRKKALKDAGGWSEWCLTEDSELAIRIHASGYTSVYTNVSMGKGLIPETFDGYKKQRFRWTAGPIQEIKHHFKLLAPWGKTSSKLTLLQKFEHFNHGLDRAKIGVQSLLLPIGLFIILSMIIHHEQIPMPFVMWEFITVMFVTGILLHFFVYSTVMGASILEAFGGTIASQSLQYTIMLACVKTLFTDKMTWVRTNKFSETASFARAIQSVKAEVSLGVAALLCAALIIFFQSHSGILVMFAIGLLMQSLTFFSSLYMAYLAELDLSKK